MKRRAAEAAAAEAAATRALEDAAMAYAVARAAAFPSPVGIAVRSRDLVRAAKKCTMQLAAKSEPCTHKDARRNRVDHRWYFQWCAECGAFRSWDPYGGEPRDEDWAIPLVAGGPR